MVVKYSLLSTEETIISNTEYLDTLLNKGIKIILFTTSKNADEICKSRTSFVEAKLLQIYVTSCILPTLTIIDGVVTKENTEQLEFISNQIKEFNYEQFKIEHANPNEDISVEAGAGTGKTTVMLDRIMFLLHTIPDLSLEDIGMITFTNEATLNMKHKLQERFITRFKVTHQPKYIKYLEDNSKLRIQTIDSFSKEIISELGSAIGYGNEVSIKSFKYEKRQLVKSVLNDLYKGKHGHVDETMGGRIHELENIILAYWEQLENISLSTPEIVGLDWGKNANNDSLSLHNTLQNIFSIINAKYDDMKMKRDAIAVSDIVRELRKILENGNDLVWKSHPLRFLFVDEFQDSDNAQISTIAWLRNYCNIHLFVVGDVKQSIYRFRGAQVTAFEQLKKEITHGEETVQSYSLNKNYRTSQEILEPLDLFFQKWRANRLLDYAKKLDAQRTHSGIIKGYEVINRKTIKETETIELVKKALADCKLDAERKKVVDTKTQKVVVLARTNYQLYQLEQWCQNAKPAIPCYIKAEGTFFQSAAVRDLFILVKACLFQEDACCLLDLIKSPYIEADLSLNSLSANTAQENLDNLKELIRNEKWTEYLKSFRLKPVLSVLRSIIDDIDPVKKYAAIQKYALSNAEGEWTEELINKKILADSKQYEANLDKLFQIFRERFTGEMVSLMQIYSFLKICIATDHSEDEPDISDSLDYKYLYGLTVHKAKGLEFDTILLPFTERLYRRECETEVLIEENSVPRKIGWSVVEWEDWTTPKRKRCNKYYREMIAEEFSAVDKEEARLLYVAMTRAIRRLEFFTIGNEEHSWSYLLRMK